MWFPFPFGFPFKWSSLMHKSMKQVAQLSDRTALHVAVGLNLLKLILGYRRITVDIPQNYHPRLTVCDSNNYSRELTRSPSLALALLAWASEHYILCSRILDSLYGRLSTFDGVHAFGYNSTESEPILIKLEHSEYIIWHWLWQILSAIRAV